MGQARFFLDGNRINGTQAPSQLELEDDDVIECYIEKNKLFPFLLPTPPSDARIQVGPVLVPLY